MFWHLKFIINFYFLNTTNGSQPKSGLGAIARPAIFISNFGIISTFHNLIVAKIKTARKGGFYF